MITTLPIGRGHSALRYLVLSFTKTFRTLLLASGLLIVFSVQAKAQASDYWRIFEQISLLNELQVHYQTISLEEVRNHVVMNHGPEIPSFSSDGLSTNFTVEIVEKPQLLNSGRTEFFLIHESKIQLNSALLDVVYYYDFAGKYEHFVSVSAKLIKENGSWKIVEHTIK
jgi:hypothetical protein